MLRTQKEQLVSSISDKFRDAKAAFVVDFKGMNVEKVTSLRKKLRANNAEMKVVRNTLALRALQNHKAIHDLISNDLTGNNAIVFAYSDIIAPAKTLDQFLGEVEELQFKTGVFGTSKIGEKDIKTLANLPAKEVLQAKFLGLLQAPMQRFVTVLNQVPAGFVRTLNAYKATKEA